METKEADKSANDHVYTAYIENSYQRKDENEKIFVVRIPSLTNINL